LVTVTNDETNVIRIAKVKDVMKAHRKPILRLELDQLDIPEAEIAHSKAFARIQDLFIPEQVSNCEIIEGEDPGEKVEKLLFGLKQQKLF
jgi:electron transfer flavoprotein beta subunit